MNTPGTSSADAGEDTLAPYVSIWTDGSCSGNPGPGGWAAIIRRENGEEKEISGAAPDTTNNRMELTAAIEGLKCLVGTRKVLVRSDSEIIVKGMTEWLPGWIERGWRNAKGTKIANADLWKALVEMASRHDVQWQWVRGHARDPMNERVDRLAVKARDRALASQPPKPMASVPKPSAIPFQMRRKREAPSVQSALLFEDL